MRSASLLAEERAMKILIELTSEEAQLLKTHLSRYLEHLDKELVRTDKHELQHKLASEVRALQRISDRLGSERAA
jgi:hypothetical protein